MYATHFFSINMNCCFPFATRNVKLDSHVIDAFYDILLMAEKIIFQKLVTQELKLYTLTLIVDKEIQELWRFKDECRFLVKISSNQATRLLPNSS